MFAVWVAKMHIEHQELNWLGDASSIYRFRNAAEISQHRRLAGSVTAVWFMERLTISRLLQHPYARALGWASGGYRLVNEGSSGPIKRYTGAC
jgi:hypothetical protein